MNIYYVFRNKKISKNDYNSAIFIKEGFCFYAFLFNIFWIIYKKMWVVAFCMLVLSFALDFIILKVLNRYDIYLLFRICVSVLFGFIGNNLFSWHLQNKNYNFVALIIGKNTLDAGRRYWLDAE